MTDSINRQAVFDIIHHAVFEFFDICEDDEESPMTEKDKMLLSLNKAISIRIKQLPSVEPRRKNGEWIDEPIYKQTMDGKTWDGYTYCSECKEMHEYGYRSKYCPNCGAEMREKEKEYESE